MKTTILIGAIALMSFSACGTMSNDGSQVVTEQQQGVAEDVDVAKFAELVNSGNGFVLDVSTPDEYAAGHLEGSTLINVFDEDFEEQVKKLDPNTPVYVYCRSGRRSANAMEILHKNGFAEVYKLKGGIMAWQQAGNDVVQ